MSRRPGCRGLRAAVVAVALALASGQSRAGSEGPSSGEGGGGPRRDETTPEKRGDVAVVAYLPEWRLHSANFDVICRHVSHLIFFSLEVGTKRAIEAVDRFPTREVLAEARRAARKHGTRLLVCFGGNGRSAGFSRMVRKPKLRATFARSVRTFLDAHGLDGVDLNWEYPGWSSRTGSYLGDDDVAADYDGLADLASELRATLGPDKTITMAYYPDSRQEVLLLGAARHVDLLHSMAYDAPTSSKKPRQPHEKKKRPPSLDTTKELTHSPLALATRSLAQAFAFQKKHALGVPFYGRDVDARGDWTTYEDIAQRAWPLDPETDVIAAEDAPDALVGFNGVATIEAKVEAAIAADAAGVMIWEVGQDCRLEPVTRLGATHEVTCPDPKASLLLAITRAIKRSGRRRATWYPPQQRKPSSWGERPTPSRTPEL